MSNTPAKNQNDPILSVFSKMRAEINFSVMSTFIITDYRDILKKHVKIKR